MKHLRMTNRTALVVADFFSGSQGTDSGKGSNKHRPESFRLRGRGASALSRAFPPPGPL